MGLVKEIRMKGKMDTDKMSIREVGKVTVGNTVAKQTPLSSSRVINTTVSLKNLGGEKFSSSNKMGTNPVKTTGGK